GNLVEKEEESEEERGEYRGAGKEHEVCAEDAGDRPACTDVGNARVQERPEPERHERLQRRRGQPAREVPDEETSAAERVLDVVAEDPEEQHVPEDVEPAAVHEHARERAVVPGKRVPRGGENARPL